MKTTAVSPVFHCKKKLW